MARGAAQTRRKAAKAQTQRKQAPARRPPSIEDTMFFPRLRRQAKWMFVFLAFVFAGGFVFFGVGSGSGIGDLLRGNLNVFGGSGTTTSSDVKKALKRTHEHPQDAGAWSSLANAYQTEGKETKANNALQHVLKLRPNNVDALQRVAAYYETRATQKDSQARSLMAQAPLTLATVTALSPSSPLGQAFGGDPQSQQVTQRATALQSEVSDNIRKDEALYTRLARLQPDDVNTQYHYAQLADFIGDTSAALTAYKKVVRLAPSDPSATQARQRIAQLRLSAPSVTRR
jgi:tetratricopeptide (TPR) repeat protein